MPARNFDVLIVGGGQAGRRAAQGARAAAPEASIAIVGEEAHLPYERPPLSKELLLGTGDHRLCFKGDAASYEAAGIELVLGERVAALDLTAKTVRCASGVVLGFGKLVLATGSRPRSLGIPITAPDCVGTLRTLDDSARIASHLREDAHLVVIGAGFIGLEVASAAIARGARVTVLEAGDRVLGRVFPIEAGARVERLHRDAGVDVRLRSQVLAIAPSLAGARVETRDGDIEADFVVIGVGVTPNVELARAAGLVTDDGIAVTAEGATSHPDVFAAGEVTRHPLPNGRVARLESWQVAELQAEAAGRSAAGAPTAYAAIPYFWTDQLGVNIQMFGLLDPAAPIVTRRAVGEILFAVDQDACVQGAVGFNAGAEMSVAKRLIGAPITPEFTDPAIPLRKMLRAGP